MFITITGMPASGKSTICNILKNKYGFEIFDTARLQREFAEKQGISILEHNKNLMNDVYGYDNQVDKQMTDFANNNKGKNIVFDARLGWFFVKDSFKVFLTVDPKVSAEKVVDRNSKTETFATALEAYNSLLERRELENKRFKKLYNADCNNMKNFDLVVDTSNTPPERAEEVAELIMKEIKKKP